MDIKTIFESITPENIKDIPLIKTAMDIFIKNLEENAYVASSIKEIYNNAYKSADPEHIQECKLELRKGLLDVYLHNLYNTLQKAQNNKIIRQKMLAHVETMESQGRTVPFVNDIERVLNDEYFTTNKIFKQNTGNELGIRYSYNLTKYLTSGDSDGDLEFTEIKPFHFKVEGAVYKEMYENIIKPLSHPLGFTYFYIQIIQAEFSDLYGIDIIYNVNSIEMRNIDGRFHVFTPDADDTNIKALFLEKYINPLTGLIFRESEYNEQVTVFYNKVVQDVEIKNVQDRYFRGVLFTDGTYLTQYTNPIAIKYCDFDDWETHEEETYVGHWSLYLDYELDFEFQYYDTFATEEQTGFEDTVEFDEELLIYIENAIGYYFHSDEESGAVDQYIYTTDDFYIVNSSFGYYFRTLDDQYLFTFRGYYINGSDDTYLTTVDDEYLVFEDDGSDGLSYIFTEQNIGS